MATIINGTANSDTIIGTPLDDAIYGLDGDDDLYGNTGSDTLSGGSGYDFLIGGDGDDILSGGKGDDYLYGDAGLDTATFSGFRSDYTVTVQSGTFAVVEDKVAGRDGTDQLRDVEYLRFTDGTFTLNSFAVTSDDYLATTSTTGAVAVGGSRTGSIETTGDQDWFRVSLVANTPYTINIEGSSTNQGTLSDTYLRGIYTSAGVLISGTSADDGGTGYNSRFSFTPTSSGDYFISAGGYGSSTGTYKLSVSGIASTNSTNLSIVPSNAPTAEGNNGVNTPFTYLVTRTGDLSGTSSVSWSVAGSGTNPTNAADFTGNVLPSGSVSFAPGAATATITVNVYGDNIFEPNEGFTVTLSNPNGATLGTSTVSTALNQSVSGGYGVTENFYNLAGGSGSFSFNYEMYGIPDRADIYVNGTLAVSTNGPVSSSGTLTIPSNTVLKAGDAVRVVMTGTDTGTAWDYTVNYQGGVQALNYIAAGNVINDDANITVAASLSIAPSNAPTAEGNNGVNTPFTYLVTRTGDLSGTSSVSWSVAGSGTNPTNAADFTGNVLPSGSVSFAPGAATATITVNVYGDNIFEPNEGFTVTLSNPNGATLGTSTVSTALNQSVSGGYGVTENFYNLAGGSGSFSFNYEMYGIPDRADIYVNGTLAVSTNGPVSNSGTLTIPSSTVLRAGDAVRVVVTGTDTGTAWDYTVNYQGGVQALNYIAAGNVINDDANITVAASLSIAPSNAPTAEGNNGVNTPFTYLVTRTGDLSGSSSVNWSVAGSGANPTNAADFTGNVLPSGSVSFAPGAATATITVNVYGDNVFEPNEGFTVTLSNPNGATLGTSTVSTALNQSVSGGYGVTENFYNLAGGSGSFSFNYNMYSIPDRADIYVNGTLAVSTNGPVSSSGTLTIPSNTVLKAGDAVRVVMTGTDTGTAWDYTVNYQGGVQALNYIAAGNVINDDSPPNPGTSSHSNIYISATTPQAFTIADSGMSLFGGSSREVITINAGVNTVKLNQNIDRVNLPGASSSFTFKQAGNQLVVYDSLGANVIVTLPLQGDADGTQIGFGNGVFNAKLSSGVMSLGGAVVNPSAPTGVNPATLTSTLEPTPSSSSSASAYLQPNDVITIANSGVKVFGSSGAEALTLTSATNGIVFDQNMDRINLPGSHSNYKFLQTGNQINIYDALGTTLIARGPVQSDGDGTLLSFDNGVGSVLISGGVMRLGGSVVSTATPSAITSSVFTNSGLVAVSGSGSGSAAGGDVTYTLAMGNYAYSISGFGPGDKIVSPAGVTPTLENGSYTDGSVMIQAASAGQTVQITLTGLTSAQDLALNSVLDLNAVFGVGTLT